MKNKSIIALTMATYFWGCIIGLLCSDNYSKMLWITVGLFAVSTTFFLYFLKSDQ